MRFSDKQVPRSSSTALGTTPVPIPQANNFSRAYRWCKIYPRGTHVDLKIKAGFGHLCYSTNFNDSFRDFAGTAGCIERSVAFRITEISFLDGRSGELFFASPHKTIYLNKIQTSRCMRWHNVVLAFLPELMYLLRPMELNQLSRLSSDTWKTINCTNWEEGHLIRI